MAHAVTLQINGDTFSVDLNPSTHYTIREDDLLKISVVIDVSSNPPVIFFEDAEVGLELSADGVKLTFQTPKLSFFAECFGQAYARIYVEDLTYSIFFNVRAKKASAEQAFKMISYLVSHHENIIKSCFSRSTLPIGTKEEGTADPESIITAAEDYVSSLLTHRSELMATKRERLVQTRQPLWKANRTNCNIDPLDILNNLDAISPTTPEGDLFLRGRHFSIGEIDVSTLQETADVQENQILLGGLYSIRSKINNLLDSLNPCSPSPAPTDGYESFDHLVLKLTSAGMIMRCKIISEQAGELIRLLEHRMGVRYKGDIRPIMTPYARTSKIYRIFYTYLANWYTLGQPNFGANNFLVKLKSLDKLYELYSLFHIFECMLSNGWEGQSIQFHPELDNYIPREIKFLKRELKATVTYGPFIHPPHKDTKDKELVDVAHRNYKRYRNYWEPDYIIKIESDSGTIKYLILDAKYSAESTVRDFHIPNLVEKYFWGTSVYDQKRDTFTNDSIIGVLAIYPPKLNSPFIRYGKRAGLGDNFMPLPIIGAVGLHIDKPKDFFGMMRQIIERVEELY